MAWHGKEAMAACGSYVKCDPDMSFGADCYPPPVYQCEQQAVQEPAGEMDLAGFLEMDDKMLSELAAGSSKMPASSHSEWTSLFDDVLDPSTGLPLMGHPVPPLSPLGSGLSGPGGGVPPMDSWVLEETKKLEAQQRIQQRKLLDLKQTLIKTEILKNQLQIHASISQQQQHLHHHQQQLSPPPLHSPPSPPAPNPPPSVVSSPLLPTGVPSNPGRQARGNFPHSNEVTPEKTEKKTPKLPISRLPPKVHLSSCENLEISMNTDDSPPGSPPHDPEKRKVHNLIEKKYRSSINDRIGLLREMVSKHSKDNKKLQKSAVLQKTIDFIRHLEATIKRLTEENRQLKEVLAKATGQPHMGGYSQSPPVTPPSMSPRSSVSGEDSGVPPSSPDCDSGNSSPLPGAHAPYLPFHPSLPSSGMPRLLMCVLLVAVFFVNPLYFTGHHPNIIGGHTPGRMRTLSSVENPATDGYVGGVFWWGVVWVVRLLVAAVCFGWVHIRSVAQLGASSPEGVKFWRFWKQAQQDLHTGEYGACRDSVESALAVIGRPIPTSSFSLALSLVWATLSHFIFQVGMGRVGVYLASLLERKIPVGGVSASGKKHGFRVTSSEVAQAYHLLHQITMTAPGTGSHLKGLRLYLSLSALNSAEADRPKKQLPGPIVSEIYISLGLQSSVSLPYLSTLAMWYYLFRSRNQSPSQLPTQLKWTATPRGKSFLLSGRWESEVSLGSRLYQGLAALPLYSVTRAFCKELLCEAFNTLLLPPVPPTSPTQPSTDATREQFKYVLTLAKEATSGLLASHGSPGSCVSGFAVIQWWASLGLVAGHWTAGDEQEAEAYYPTIEGMLGDSTPVPTALHLAFKALRLHKRPHGNQATPTEVLLHLCGVTSNALQTCVTDMLQDHSDSVENELHQLGLLLACDWLLELRISLWEGDGGKEEGVGREITPGFYQDLGTLAKLVSLLPSALPRLRLYKGCYQLMAGANPMQAQSMLNSTGRASLLRRRGLDKEWKRVSSQAMFSHEQAMAQLLAYKHLPPSLDPTSSQSATPPGHTPNKHS